MSFSVSSMGDRSDVRISWNEDGQYPFVLYNCTVLRHKTTRRFVFSLDSINKLNDLTLIVKAHVFIITFQVKGHILYGTV